jgi:hypothetical protein
MAGIQLGQMGDAQTCRLCRLNCENVYWVIVSSSCAASKKRLKEARRRARSTAVVSKSTAPKAVVRCIVTKCGYDENALWRWGHRNKRVLTPHCFNRRDEVVFVR